MRVKVREVFVNKGPADQNNNPYNFAKVKVRNEEKSICFWVNIDNKVYPSDKIKKGDVYDIYFKSENSIHVSDVELVFGDKTDTVAQIDNGPNFQNFDDVFVDASIGEVVEQPPLPEPSAEVLAAHERDKAKQNKK